MGRLLLQDGAIISLKTVFDTLQTYRIRDLTQTLERLFERLGLLYAPGAMEVTAQNDTLTIAPGVALVRANLDPETSETFIVPIYLKDPITVDIPSAYIGTTDEVYLYLKYKETEEPPAAPISPHEAYIDAVAYLGRKNDYIPTFNTTYHTTYPPDNGMVYLGYFKYVDGNLTFYDGRDANIALFNQNLLNDNAPPPVPQDVTLSVSPASVIKHGHFYTVSWNFASTDTTNVMGVEVWWEPEEPIGSSYIDDMWHRFVPIGTNQVTIEIPENNGVFKVRSVGYNGRHSDIVVLAIPTQNLQPPTANITAYPWGLVLTFQWEGDTTNVWGAYVEALLTRDGATNARVYRVPLANNGLMIPVLPSTAYQLTVKTIASDNSIGTAANTYSGVTPNPSIDDIDSEGEVLRTNSLNQVSIRNFQDGHNVATIDDMQQITVDMERNVANLLESKADASHTHPEYVTRSEANELVVNTVASSLSMGYITIPLTAIQIDGTYYLHNFKFDTLIYVNRYSIIYENKTGDTVEIFIEIPGSETPYLTLQLAPDTSMDTNSVDFAIPAGTEIVVRVTGTNLETELRGTLTLHVTHNYKLTSTYQRETIY